MENSFKVLSDILLLLSIANQLKALFMRDGCLHCRHTSIHKRGHRHKRKR